MTRSHALLRTTLFASGGFFAAAAAATDWPQWGFEPAHSANNTAETTVSAANVADLEQKYAVSLTGRVNAAPVYAQGIATPGGIRNLLFVTAQSGRISAIDTADGSVVWTMTTPGGHTPIESSPAIDPDRQYVYSYGADGKVHKYAIGDGSESTTGGWPVTVTLKPGVEKGASALATAVVDGVARLYAVTNGYVGDGGDYQGHLVTIDLATGASRVFNSMCSMTTTLIPSGGCDSPQSGIWGRPGAVYDAGTGRVYITTSNGEFNASTGGTNWGDTVLALNPDGTGAGGGMPLDSHTPTNYAQLDSQDIDLGSASLSILPAPAGSTVAHIGVQTGKDSKLHLIDLDDMSGTGAPGGVGGEIELIDVPISEFWMKTQSVVWVDTHGDGAAWVYVGNGSGISGLKLTLTASNVPHLQPTWQQNSNSTSAIIANDVLYHAGSCSGGTCVLARNPKTGAVLWTSPAIGSLKWGSPIFVDGALYMINYASTAKLYKFALPAPTDIIFANGFDG
ncbi:MAG: outer membrane protein assembly factor BamB family protein [Dokdonella sp.]|uniref:outer membrane protein assembly factor BamB family protein n=1 Tax=Dokdonella sp. TaxID=2291710 RepID=UPI003F8009D5